MDEHILPGDPPLPVRLRRSSRARRVSLRIGAADGRATLTVPARAALRDALAFLASREGWLRGHLARLPPPPEPPAMGAPVPFEGRALTLAPGARPALDGDRLLAPPGREGPAVLAVLKAAARDRLLAACARHAAGAGRAHGRLTLRDPRSRWGSCSGRGDLMFSWRLVMAPPFVLDAVAAHECAHLVHMDHSPAFWALAHRLHPGQAEARAWLRAHGAALHRLAVP